MAYLNTNLYTFNKFYFLLFVNINSMIRFNIYYYLYLNIEIWVFVKASRIKGIIGKVILIKKIYKKSFLF